MANTSITDRPVECIEDEALDVLDYSRAMVSFISDCSTPLTVGIQGEWGSGKTSMMNIIRGEIAESNITAWVNTWEYSMFKQPQEIVPSVMRGLLENLRGEFEKKYKWPSSLTDKMAKISGFLKGVSQFALDVGVQKATGKDGFSSAVSQSASVAPVLAEIAEIKKEIQKIIDTLIEEQQNPYTKVIFFIDDLDRIEPSQAVSILEALKNLFDVRHCVFVLAIDYDVVVKGLESKFGKKTQENEREFRSFFDKIIQVPFSMPISAYNIDKLIQGRLDALGFCIDQKYLPVFKDIVSYTVGSNPRSIKRYLNTFSLLKRIRDIDEKNATTNRGELDFALFALIGVQIAYPRIYQLILKDPDFIHWDSLFAGRCAIEVSIPEEYVKNELFDEFWEQTVWSYCQSDSYLKVRATSILNAMNLIRRVLGDNDLDEIMASALQIANITSVDDDQESNQVKFKRVRLDGWDAYEKAQLERGIQKDVISLFKRFHDLIMGKTWAKGIFCNYSPRDVSFNAEIPKRKKVFVYASPRKKCLCLYIAGTEERVALEPNESIPVDVIDKVVDSYRIITEI